MAFGGPRSSCVRPGVALRSSLTFPRFPVLLQRSVLRRCCTCRRQLPSRLGRGGIRARGFPQRGLRPRLLGLAQAFFEQPTASIPMALHGDAGQSKAAYRFFNNPQVDRQTLLHPHYEATARHIREHPLVLVAQDTTRLNYDAHANTHGLGPINTRADGAQGLKRHDTLTLTPQGVPLGLIDIEVWAREARVAELEIRCAPTQLRSPKRLKGAPALSLWAMHAISPHHQRAAKQSNGGSSPPSRPASWKTPWSA